MRQSEYAAFCMRSMAFLPELRNFCTLCFRCNRYLLCMYKHKHHTHLVYMNPLVEGKRKKKIKTFVLSLYPNNIRYMYVSMPINDADSEWFDRHDIATMSDCRSKRWHTVILNMKEIHLNNNQRMNDVRRLDIQNVQK